MMNRLGAVRACPENALRLLDELRPLIVFPEGSQGMGKPFAQRYQLKRFGRGGFVKLALRTGAPIVPVVSVGGQETQLFLSRGRRLARALGLTALERRLFRTDILPVSFGFPFGLSVLIPVNMPLPAKIVAEVLEPIDVATHWALHPDVAVIDGRVRRAMQAGLDRLARRRRLPIFG